jgi:mono/diheme cytochrome c family protein
MTASVMRMGLDVIIATVLAALTLWASGTPSMAQSTNFLSTTQRYPEQSGEELYRAACQGCHMQDARGAVGAGAYPAFVADAKLETAGYPILLVVRGRKAMPAFGYALNDDQVAAVVNYVRSHFGNSYTDEVSAADVKAARQ